MTEEPERSLQETEAEGVAGLVDALADPETRHAAAYLADAERASLAELADVVTGWVNAGSGEVASRTDRDRTRVHLYHVALPRLAELGVVAFDPSARTVRLATDAERVRRILAWYESRGLARATDRPG